MKEKGDIDAVLLPGETVLWKGAPDWSKAAAPKKFWRGKAIHFLWILGLATAVLTLWYLGEHAVGEGFSRVVLGIFIVLLVIALIIATSAFLDFKQAPLANELYAITDRRILILGNDDKSRRSIAPAVILQVNSVANGDVYDLRLWYGHEDNEAITFRAISDHAVAEKLILEKFLRTQATS